MKVPIKSIKPNPSNPRVLKDWQYQKLKKSITEFPKMLELRPIVVDDDGIILGGNMRYRILQELKYKEVEIVRASELTEEEKKRFIIADNVSFGEWDNEVLANEWDVELLSDWGLDLEFDTNEVLEATEDDYEVPQEIQTDIQIGDIFEIGEHRLMCGDSTNLEHVEKLMNGNKADMVFTSPPYNTGNFSLTQGVKKKQYAKNIYKDVSMDVKSSEDYVLFNEQVIKNICQVVTQEANIAYNIGYNQNSSQEYIQIISNALKLGLKLHETIIWEKAAAIPLPLRLTRKTEFIFLLSKNKSKNTFSNQEKNQTEYNLWKISNINSQHNEHNACFPVALPSKGISLFCLKDGIIYEPFAGSGSTMVASHQLKRKCYGMELEPKYCQVIIDRMLKLDPTLTVNKVS